MSGTTTANFINRGIASQLSWRGGAWTYGAGAGIDQRAFRGENLLGTIDLAGVTDTTWYLGIGAGRGLGRSASVQYAAYARYFDSGLSFAPDVSAYGGNASYRRAFLPRLNAVAAVALDAYDREGVPASVIASALLGASYSF